MFLFKKQIIPETHRGVLFKNEQFQKMLLPGVHQWRDWKNQYRVLMVDISDTLETGVTDEVMKIVQLHPDKLAEHVQCWETGEQEVGLVYQNNVLKEIKAPAQQGAYWKGFGEIEIRKIDISEHFKLDNKLARIVLAAKAPLLRNSALNSVITSTVAERHLGFLEVDG